MLELKCWIFWTWSRDIRLILVTTYWSSTRRGRKENDQIALKLDENMLTTRKGYKTYRSFINQNGRKFLLSCNDNYVWSCMNEATVKITKQKRSLESLIQNSIRSLFIIYNKPLISKDVWPDPTAVRACSIWTSFPDGLLS